MSGLGIAVLSIVIVIALGLFTPVVALLCGVVAAAVSVVTAVVGTVAALIAGIFKRRDSMEV